MLLGIKRANRKFRATLCTAGCGNRTVRSDFALIELYALTPMCNPPFVHSGAACWRLSYLGSAPPAALGSSPGEHFQV